MSNKAITWAFGLQLANPGAKFVLVALADHATDHAGEDWTCFPSSERLAEFTSMPMRTLERHIAWLEEQGWITRERPRTARGRMKVTHYRLHPAGRPESPAAQGPAADCPPANMAGGETGSPPAKNDATTRQKVGSPPANMAGGYNKDEPPENPQEPPLRACAREVDPFDGVLGEWLAAERRHKHGRTSPEDARRAWDRAVLTIDPQQLARACRRALGGDRDFHRRGPTALQNWLGKGLFATWLDPTEGVPSPASAAVDAEPADWPAPPEALRQAFVAAHGEAKAVSWFPVGWIEDGRTVIARNGVARDWLNREAKRWLLAHTLTVVTADEARRLKEQTDVARR